MATRYWLGDSQYPHFNTFALFNLIDALSKPVYKDILVDSLKHCQQKKGLIRTCWSSKFKADSIAVGVITSNCVASI